MTNSTMFEDKRGKKGGSAALGFSLVAVITIVIVALLLTAVAPTVFANSSNVSGAPSFFNVLYPILLGICLIIVLVVLVISMLRKVGA